MPSRFEDGTYAAYGTWGTIEDALPLKREAPISQSEVTKRVDELMEKKTQQIDPTQLLIKQRMFELEMKLKYQ